MISAGTSKIIAIGASTGGVEALEKVLSRFSANIPPIVLVIHMPLGFTKLFAARFNDKMSFAVKEAQTGDNLQNGLALVAPAGEHMEIFNNAGRLSVRCFEGPKVQHVIPSVDVLFNSVANVQKSNAIGAILTGMGADGAQGLLHMRQKGALTIGQDQKTCAIYGMPKVAMEMGAVMHQLPLDKIGDKIISLV